MAKSRKRKAVAPKAGDVIGENRCRVCKRVIETQVFVGKLGPFREVKGRGDFLAGSKMVYNKDRKPYPAHEWRCPDHLDGLTDPYESIEAADAFLKSSKGRD